MHVCLSKVNLRKKGMQYLVNVTMNEEKFTGKAKIYSKYRPDYPKELFDYLYTEVGLKDSSVIADIGAGTGIFSKNLLLKGSQVFGIEPNDDMRQVAEKNLKEFKKFTPIKGSAEHTALSDSSVDFITVAQAFHWFDRVNFQSECQRILKQGGKVILVWNSRDELSDLVLENDRINKKYCRDYKGFSGGTGGGGPENYADFFKAGKCETKIFRNDLYFDQESFIGRNLSSSYAPKEGTKEYQGYKNELKLLFIKYNKNGELQLPNLTESYVGEV